jgi:hypothetical protein
VTDWWSEITTTDTPTPATAQPREQKTDWWREVTTSPAQPELRAAPFKAGGGATGVVDKPELGAPNLVNARASLAVDPKDQIKRYAEHFQQPEGHFGVINGEIVRWVPEENAFAKVVPSMGGQSGVGDTIRAGIAQSAAAAGPTAPQLTGTIAGVIMGPTGASIPVSAVVAGLTDWSRQALDKVLSGEPAVPFAGADYDYMNMAGHATMVGAGQAIAVGLNRLLTRNPMGIEAFDRVKASDQVDQAKWLALEQEAEARGVHLSAGQKTELRSLMAKERQLSRYNETADMMHSFRENQWRTEVPQAFRAEVQNIAPQQGREAMIQSFREGADKVVNSALGQRAGQATAAYQQAYGAHQSLDSPALRDIWARAERAGAIKAARDIANARGESLGRITQGLEDTFGPLDAEMTQLARQLAREGKLEVPTGGMPTGLSLQTWDRVRQGVWKLVEDNTDQLGKRNALGSAYAKMWGDLTKELESLTGGPQGAWGAARLAYGQGSEAVEQVLSGGVGVIQKMSGPDRVSMVTRIFDGRSILPEEVARTRELFVKAGQESAWNSGIAAHLANILDESIKSAGISGNVPGQVYSRLGRDALQHDAVVAAVGPQKAASFEKLLEVMVASSRSLPEGSPTATDLLAAPNTVSKTIKIAGKVLSPQTWFNLGNEAVAGLEAMRTPAANIKLAEYLLSDKSAAALQRFQMLSKTQQGAVVGMVEVMQNAGIIATGARKPADFAPPVSRTLQNPSEPLLGAP